MVLEENAIGGDGVDGWRIDCLSVTTEISSEVVAVDEEDIWCVVRHCPAYIELRE